MKRINMLTNSQIVALYTGVPPAELEGFKTFLEDYPYRFVTFDGTDWAYIATEEYGGGEVVLVLSGALCAPEVSWKTIAALAGKYRVIAPEYPPLDRMDALVDGIAAILQREEVVQAHVLGGSYGGFVAQVFVRRYPELTRSLVLSHTLPPDAESAESTRKIMPWLALLPGSVLRWLMGKRLSALLPEKTAETAALYAIYQEVLRFRLTKADLMSLLWRTIDFNGRVFTADQLSDWPGKVLLVLADDDPGTPEEVRERLHSLYPQAQMHLFHGSGHATAVVRQDDYLAIIDSFLHEQG
jgi:pimeloyl-ACP methyl ester carboxylesterase